jgi:tyrosine-protein kinase Etk/Wzc
MENNRNLSPGYSETFVVGDSMESLPDKLSKFLIYWPLFLLSIALCLGLAYIYVKSAKPVYTITAKLLIKDEKNEQVTDDSHNVFKDSKKVDDEIEILKSRTLMKQVVNDLQLWTQYQGFDELHDIDIYATTPVNFTLLTPSGQLGGQSIIVTIKDEKTFILKQPHSNETFNYGKQLSNAWGGWELKPTENLKNYIGKTIRINLYSPEAVTDGYLDSFNAFLSNEQASVVELKIREFVPERGEDIVNRIITAYNLASIEYKNRMTENTLHFLDERLASITGELTTVEKHVAGYKSSRGLTDISSESKFYLDNVKDNDSRLNEVNIQLQVINQIQTYVNSANATNNPPATVGISDPGLMSLIDQLIKLQLQRDKLLSNTPEENPIFVPLNRQIKSTKSAIYENIKGIKRSLLATRNQLEKYNLGFESSIKKLPGQEREYISIKRQQSIKEELYIYLLQKREEAALSSASKIVGSRTVDSAHYGAPESLNSKYTYALAFVFGLILPGGIIFAKNSLNNRINETREIEDAVYVPILGELVYKKSKAAVISLDSSRTLISEQFRILRTNLQQINGKTGDGNITLLTSGMPGEGKSMITRNLGAVMAAAGRRTVILEVDFRRPNLAKSLSLEGVRGLSDYLNGNAYKEDIIQDSQVHPNLFVISTGTQPDNPSELLEKPAMEDLLEWLRIHFDEILIDTPPVKLVTDAMILAEFSDVNLYVVRYGFTYKSELKFIKQLYIDQKMKNLHIIFNGISAKGNNSYAKAYAYDYYTDSKPKFGLSFFNKN